MARPIRRSALLVLLALVAAPVACGGSPSSPKPPRDAPTGSAPSPLAAVDAGADAMPAPPTKDRYATAEDAEHKDDNELDGPIVMTPLVPKNTPKSAFPKATVKDGESCVGAIPWSGNHKNDYQTIAEKCGAPTGMLKYAEPRDGRLHAKKDKRDVFQIKVYKNMCYRYLAVADDGIKDIDILVLKKGAIQAMDRTDHPVAVIEPDKLWCVDDDMELDFAIEIDGPGAGHYTFGVWTRPK